MAGTITFFLKEPNPGEDRSSNYETLIYLAFRYGQNRIKVSTGERIRPKYWNRDTNKARVTKEFTEGGNLNTRLETQGKEAMKAVRDHLNANGAIYPDKLRNELVRAIRPEVRDEPGEITFLAAIQEYIDTCNKAERTKLAYGTTLNVLKEYREYIKHPITFDSVNIDFYNHFVNYLTRERQFAKNTIGGHIKEIKVFMDYANDKGYTTNKEHRNPKFKKTEETAETIYLTDKELSILYNLDLSENPKLERVRDIFIIGSYTGLRFSDLSQLTPDKFTNGGSQLRVKTIKTGETVVIPLHWTIKEILSKYNGSNPRVISNQKFNVYLKEIGQRAEMYDKVILTKTKGGLSYYGQFQKWELITVHTARRSFATNMFIAGVPTISIMKITGHRTERAFMKYIKITAAQNAETVSKHPYFEKSPLKIVSRPKTIAVNE